MDVWFCPELSSASRDATLRHLARSAAAAVGLRARWPGQLVFCVGGELTLFMRGIIKGRTYSRRTRMPALREILRSGACNAPLNAFLARAAAAVRECSAARSPTRRCRPSGSTGTHFDIIGINHYWMEPHKDL